MKNKHGPTASNTPHTTLPNAPHTLCLSMMHCDALPAADEPETTCRASHATARAVLWCGDWSLATDSAPKNLGLLRNILPQSGTGGGRPPFPGDDLRSARNSSGIKERF